MRFARAIAMATGLAALLVSCDVPRLTYADDLPDRDASVDSAEPAVSDGFVGPFDGHAPSADQEPSDSGPGTPDAVAETPDAQDAPDRPPSGPHSTCSNGVIDPDETGVDCGGPECPRCRGGGTCRSDGDCVSAFCHRGACAQATCVDHIKNLRETDIDCGGRDCLPCNVGATCTLPEDCALQNCVDSKCQPRSCDDHVQTVGETDVDCGGAFCAPCPAGQRCLVGRDCVSGLCPSSGRCEAPTCTDDAQNGGEADKNCGGPSCPRCLDGQTCRTGADCASGVCATVCQPPSCSDQVKNDSETDIDCGGSCPTRCSAAQRCAVNADCATQNCNVTCQPCPADMVAVTGATTPYCIDATEVTVAAYARFLQTAPRTSSIPDVCRSKVTFVPGSPVDLARPGYPVNHVDWCDAATFCLEAGRHLCGRIGERSPLLTGEVVEASKSEWFAACAGAGLRAFPYGDVFAPALCSGADRPPGSGLWTTGGNLCEGGVAGVFDMSGNVAEWEDNCTGGGVAGDTCEVRGGSYLEGGNEGAELRCASTRTLRRFTDDNPAIGFRCCL